LQWFGQEEDDDIQFFLSFQNGVNEEWIHRDGNCQFFITLLYLLILLTAKIIVGEIMEVVS
jgi:hypothetical protein